MGMGIEDVKLPAEANECVWNWPDAPGQQLVSPDQWSEISLALKLSEREQQVCRLLMDGDTRLSIANQLGIKGRTVRQYLEQLHVKLKVNNRVGLVLRVIQVRDSMIQDHCVLEKQTYTESI